ncbi:MAG: thioesterase family protein [Anaerolineae bacterium]
MPSAVYTLPLPVRLYDLDLRGEVSNGTLFRYFEEAAIQASAHAGFTMEWYNSRGQFWVIRTMRMERSAPACFGDELQIRTWVSSLARVRSDRNYVLRRGRDGQVLARATANWVYLDVKTMYPARIAPEIAEMFGNPEPAALPPRPRPRWLSAPPRELQSVSARRAQYYEADSARHTNNAMYVDWLEEAVRGTLLANGYALPLDNPPSLWFHRHSIEYLNAARPGDPVEISTRLAGRARSAGYWVQEIRRAGSGERIARNECMTVWRGVDNRLTTWDQL